MPPRSEKQRRAMQAASHGNSTLGIPKSVGQDFSSADPGGKLPEAAPSPTRPQKRGSTPELSPQKRSGSLSARSLFSKKGK